MKILVTGATGFVGRHVVDSLVAQGHEVIATSRNADRARSMSWFDQVLYIPCDLHDPHFKIVSLFGTPDVLVHLAWPGLPNYEDLFHYEDNLPAAYRFVKTMVLTGTKQILVTGTCLEYGMQSGPLSEEMPTLPSTPYGLAKDTLRKFLESLKNKSPFVLQWMRLFYMYGAGQNENSLMAQLDKAIDKGDKFFHMSDGQQLRDYLPVTQVAQQVCFLVENAHVNGMINCCSGKPVSVRQLVEKRIQERGAKIKINLGHYPYPDHEPMAFWGKTLKHPTHLPQSGVEKETLQ